MRHQIDRRPIVHLGKKVIEITNSMCKTNWGNQQVLYEISNTNTERYQIKVLGVIEKSADSKILIRTIPKREQSGVIRSLKGDYSKRLNLSKGDTIIFDTVRMNLSEKGTYEYPQEPKLSSSYK